MVFNLKGKYPSNLEAIQQIDLQNVHLIGVAGTGLRGLAAILTQRGVFVSGSEPADSPVLEDLLEMGVECYVGHKSENVPPETQALVISAAVSDDNPEVVEAQKRNLPIFKYAEFIGFLMSERQGIAIAGTHGKTTTTAMTAQALLQANKRPGFIIGGDYPTIGGSASWGGGEHFIAEACEFDRSFLNLRPHFGIITNVEEDHLDYFSSIEDIKKAFAQFIHLIDAEGFLVINADDPHSDFLAKESRCSIGKFSLKPHGGDWWAEDLKPLNGGHQFKAVSRTGESIVINLSVPGVHNVKNALAVLVLLQHLEVPLETVAQALEKFQGVKRRFEILLKEPAVVIDDYAHHPTEIEMVIKAARETFPKQRIRVIFQPHQYSRTYRFLWEFAETLSSADEVLVTEVFAARDSHEDIRRIDSKKLVEAIIQQGGKARFSSGFDSVIKDLLQSFKSGDVLLCLGAGDITYLAAQIAEALNPGNP